jgi:L-asparaginase II
VFPRSAIKALQALPLLANGGADRFGLNDAELALACASHTGLPIHTQVAAGMLEKAGRDVTCLECGTHWPSSASAARALAAAGQSPSALHNNCSGKHAGFLCLACALHGGGDLRGYARGYVTPQHPVMREVSAAVQATTGHDVARTPTGVDGCSIPTHSIPLVRLAHAFARVATGVGLSASHAGAARRLRAAVANAPEMTAGSQRFDTRVMQRLGARVYCKVGAEGMFCAALPERGVGVAVKMDDGNNSRASEAVMAALIEAFVDLDGADATFMRTLSDAAQINRNGIEVGRLRAAPMLRAKGPAP